MPFPRATPFLLVLFMHAAHTRADTVHIAGSRVLAPVVVEAAKILHEERGIDVSLNTDGGTAGGIAAVLERQAQVAMCIRPATGEERAQNPGFTFTEISIGKCAVALTVSPDVWERGLHEITRAQMREIYESHATTWKKFGGPDTKIAFFNRDEGRGVWETFAEWLYGSTGSAPGVNLEIVTNDHDALDAVTTHAGAFTQLPSLLVDGKAAFTLAIKTEEGAVIDPTLKNVVLRRYPMVFPLLLVVEDRPTREIKVFVDFMLSPRGQEILRKHGYIPEADLLKEKSE